MDITEIIASLLASLFAIVFAMTAHEFAHALTATKLGDDTPRMMGRLTLNPFKHIDPIGFILLMIFGFGWAKPVQVNPLRFKNQRKGLFLTCLAGPLTNIVLAFFASLLCLLCLKFLPQSAEMIPEFLKSKITPSSSNFASILLTAFCTYFTMYNLILAIFNLIPIYPLDGSKMLMSVLKNNSGFMKFSLKYGMWLLIIVALFGGPFIFAGAQYLNNFFMMFWGLMF